MHRITSNILPCNNQTCISTYFRFLHASRVVYFFFFQSTQWPFSILRFLKVFLWQTDWILGNRRSVYQNVFSVARMVQWWSLVFAYIFCCDPMVVQSFSSLKKFFSLDLNVVFMTVGIVVDVRWESGLEIYPLVCVACWDMCFSFHSRFAAIHMCCVLWCVFPLNCADCYSIS